MNKIFATGLSVLFSCSAVFAQDLNQTIRISNDYKAGAPECDKSSVKLSVPDSASRFDYKFDYSVFDAPYKGAYEFRPFLTKMTPVSSSEKNSVFWLKAGAGYALRPELKAAWDAVNKEKFSLELHQDLNGFVGNYRSVRTDMGLKRPLWTTSGLESFGFDLSENFGGSVRFALKDSELKFFADYYGIFNDDSQRQCNYNSGLIAAKYTMERRAFDMDINLSARFARDNVSHPYETSPVYENVFKLDGYVNPLVKAKYSICLDYDLRYMMRSRNYSYNAASASLTPNVRFDFDWVKFKLGVNLSAVEKFYVRPDVRAEFRFFDGVLMPYLEVTGSAKPNDYSSLKFDNHWYNPGYSGEIISSVESINALVGLKGTVSNCFEYDVQGGYLSMLSDALWGVANESGKLRAALVYQDYNSWFAKARLAWKSRSVEADGSFTFIKTDILDRVSPSSVLMPWDLPMFSFDLRVVYNWRRRIYAGVTMGFESDRNTAYTDIENHQVAAPYYLNLGLFAEYKFNDKLRFWIKGENLLNESIQHVPMHVESGIGGTLGITLIL